MKHQSILARSSHILLHTPIIDTYFNRGSIFVIPSRVLAKCHRFFPRKSTRHSSERLSDIPRKVVSCRSIVRVLPGWTRCLQFCSTVPSQPGYLPNPRRSTQPQTLLLFPQCWNICSLFSTVLKSFLTNYRRVYIRVTIEMYRNQ